MSLKFWIIIVILGSATFLIRFSFLAIISGQELGLRTKRLMRYIPVSVFAALSVPALVYLKPASYETHEPERIVAGCVGLIVAYFTRNVLCTIAGGMVGLWTIKLMLG